MSALRSFFFSLLCLLPLKGFTSPVLLINEVSQGTQDSQEYVEFIILGFPGCGTNATSMNLQGLSMDDDNGDFSAPSGIGNNITTGSIRFSYNTFWSGIPVGTLIVIYNEANRNPLIPPDDISITDGNGRLVLPANSPLLDGSAVSPSVGNPAAIGPWVAGGGLWSYISMENAGDSFRVHHSSAIPQVWFHAVSWGTNSWNNVATSDYYYPGSAAGMVFSAGASPGYLGGWSALPAATNQTPGFPNNAANAQLITSLTTIGPPISVALTGQQETCFNACDAVVMSQVSGGVPPYIYTWNVPTTSINILTNKCAGNYTLLITDANGCTGTAQITIEATEELQVSATHTDETCTGECDGTATLAVTGGTGNITVNWFSGGSGLTSSDLCPQTYGATVEDQNGCAADVYVTILPAPAMNSSVFSAAGPYIENSPPVQLQNSISGGIYTTGDCSNCLTPDGTFDPSSAGIGVFEICYTITNGPCSSTQCQSISVNPCTPLETNESVYICEGDSILLFGNWQSQQDLYSQTFQGINCDSTHKISLLHYNVPDTYLFLDLCEEDSLFVFGNWIDSSGVFSQEIESSEGCYYTKYITVTEVFCPDEALIYIPNTFTPNGDQINDVFHIELLGAIIEEGAIFNRWGEQIAHFDTDNLLWNGNTVDAQPCPDGIYTYQIRYSTIDGLIEQSTGHVTLLR